MVHRGEEERANISQEVVHVAEAASKMIPLLQRQSKSHKKMLIRSK